MDTKRLAAFIKVVDAGSVTRAAKLLNVAQPGLSQQILTLENEFKTRLLGRSPRGVTPTPAGRTLYRHAQRILRQTDEALANVREAEESLKGHVSVGLAAWSHGSTHAAELIRAVHADYPGILLQVCDTFALPLSEMVLNGTLDMAYIYGGGSTQALDYLECDHEDFVVVLPPDLAPSSEEPVDDYFLSSVPLIMPPSSSFQRQMVERVCAKIGERPNVVVEVQTLGVLRELLSQGLGGAVLPKGIADGLAQKHDLTIRRTQTPMTLPMVICTSKREGMTDPPAAVKSILLQIIGRE